MARHKAGSTIDRVTERDDAHPVKWEGAGSGDEIMWYSIASAVARMQAYGLGSRRELTAALEAGQMLRTPFAFYSIPERVAELEARVAEDRAARPAQYR